MVRGAFWLESSDGLGEETETASRGEDRRTAAGHERQAYRELEPQSAEHSQRELQAWRQCTDASDKST